ncbi:DUF6119 family protein [Dyadobacter sp. CY351]|uniref:DUF6119 family protein n=1 Tax=Dyadobacter sp. CY351 TaxID=2909337 RepID=UPI001F329879|nr:DUF6119 family protein [Dyadobacter sp. CY351]MCF2518812.1 TIGR04141 family sporadically distributed protein [Dyadobacter sp. CY351]
MNVNPSIYRIDKKNRKLADCKTTDSILRRIIGTYYERPEFFGVPKDLDFTCFEKEEVNYYLYLFNTKETLSDWKTFLPNELTGTADFTQQQLSLLLFADTNGELYCIVGGHAFRVIIPFMDHVFGLNTYARIMKPEADELASIKSRGITGHRAGIKEQFRNNYRIIDFIKFGKIPEEIHLRLSEEISRLHFEFVKTRRNERIQVFVGKGFKIKKEVDFNVLHNIIKELRTISELAASDYLSSYKEIQDTEDIEKNLRPELITSIYNDLAGIFKRDNLNLPKFEHDFCNPNNIEKFYEADQYKLKEKTTKGGYVTFDILLDRTEIYDTVLKRAVERYGDSDKFNMMVFLQGVRVTCIKNNKTSVSSSFLFHISAEFTIKNKSVFLIDTKWYHLRSSFIDDLKINTKHVLTTYRAPQSILHIPWNKTQISRESAYNMQYNGLTNFIVIDTIIVDGIELCDLLYFDSSTIYLIHVKYGFRSEIRELNNQILIAARRLKDAVGSSDRSILGKIYDQLKEKNRFLNELTKEGFMDLFKKKIAFVMAFTSHLNEDILVENSIDRFDSNIARFSLIQCSSEMRSDYYDLLFCQIRRS